MANYPQQYPSNQMGQMQYPPPQYQQAQQPYMPQNQGLAPYQIEFKMQQIPMQQVPYYSPQQGLMPETPQLQSLVICPGVLIKQKLELIEAITGCESKNVYAIFPIDLNGDKIAHGLKFKCKESSDFCARILLPGWCRPFNLKIKDKQTDAQFLFCQRDYECTFLCASRPQLIVFSMDSNNQRRKIGHITHPFLCFEVGEDIYDASGRLTYRIRGDFCQMGIICNGIPCESCQKAIFQIRNSQGIVVQNIFKVSQKCCKKMIGDVDSFQIIFPENATADDRALLMCAVLFMDYNYFESNPSEGQPNNDW